ncbi:TPA: PLP-dependent aminotransferase family protein [Klebsiella michiganensis]|jgi:DNA-binding transcriptional MocR family regulator|uniref:MocR-like transcription factor YczR n=1 Tax=Klebsiella TaxID=570 RepID=UPI0007CCD126|nr:MULTISPECIES: PLP-dependent aminotransferase family protein [Klebsiella]EKV5140668.1 PLP-dependent aminotransferase family protein [Klebsiella michiganensis]MBA4425698.1 PLP-dependent aminotransferase family protein [Klebsiella michiganensis]MBW5961863.1 PLP-dependent aminotransferase family protein [Klebsiella michiganensis]MDK3048156.1 PLP-dependent aminotransferase family protein [Klebsiella michiganensis]MDU2423382.1 PLP-dependent aminotransferase family protein [Klebsiella michiganensi
MLSRRFGAQSLVRLLGHWQESTSRTPIWRQLAEALRLLILDGRLALETRLPGERELAAALNISRTTVASALGQLREEGYLYSRQGSGSRIALPERPVEAAAKQTDPLSVNLAVAALSAGPEIHQAYSQALKIMPEHLSNTGYDQQGLPLLREAIARRYSERGLPTRSDEVMIVNGALSGFALVLRLFTGPGDRVVVDAPTYPMALSAIQGASCRPVSVALPQQGWDCDGLAATIAQTAPRLAWLMPDFHNPTGRCMDSATRQRVADIAAQTRTTLVADETMVDLWYDAPPPPPLAAFNPDAPVITIGSAGKSFWGGLRIGWIRASSRTIASLVQARDSLDLGSPLLEQLACCWLLENENRLLPSRRAMLATRRDMCGALMAEYFPHWRFTPPEGGLSFWVELPGMLATLFSVRAESRGIHIGTGTRFGLAGAFDRYLRLPFTLSDDELRSAFTTLQPLWHSLTEQKESFRLRKII